MSVPYTETQVTSPAPLGHSAAPPPNVTASPSSQPHSGLSVQSPPIFCWIRARRYMASQFPPWFLRPCRCMRATHVWRLTSLGGRVHRRGFLCVACAYLALCHALLRAAVHVHGGTHERCRLASPLRYLSRRRGPHAWTTHLLVLKGVGSSPQANERCERTFAPTFAPLRRPRVIRCEPISVICFGRDFGYLFVPARVAAHLRRPRRARRTWA